MNAFRRSRFFIGFAGAGMVFATLVPLSAQGVLFRDPAPAGVESVSESVWLRLGGQKDAGLKRADEGLIWSTRAQSLVINQFPLAELSSAEGEIITLKLKARIYGTPSPHSFQIGLFNSAGEIVPGDKPETHALAAFVPFTGYFAAFSLASDDAQGIILYRRQANAETSDASQLFSMNSGNATYLGATRGYLAEAEEELEFTLTFEAIAGGVDIGVSVNGLSFQAIDPIPITSFDSIALFCFGGDVAEVVISQCEIVR